LERIVKPVFWTTRAINDLEKITRFNSLLFGFSKAIGIANSIKKATEILENATFDFSEIGAVDSEFTHLKREYRKLIIKDCKITYREGNDKIYVNRIFDTRQNPNKNR
jgi:plasmid stabilization system protein ParE